MIKKLIPQKLINYLKIKLGVPSQKSSLTKLKNLGFEPKNILDIGAYEGNWGIEIAEIFPEAHILMIEGQRSKEDKLLKIAKNLKNAEVLIALLGAEVKMVNFNIYETASSVFTENNVTNAKIEEVQLNLLDDILENQYTNAIDFIKIDTQGYELEILKGGLKTLHNAQAVLLEVSLLNIYNDAPLVDQVMAFMSENGYALYDICTLMPRPYDKALFQSDFLFLKKDHLLRSSSRWD
ncbi:FkbM family methyltransferase [Pedobacter sp. GR22-10]|jgi:FkbM family methyltransferase|uniref:FkbM family methyltransferase n=1 Tax=Pedobacter sp. GR22-10 TaxID=2994472 RepID=UPI002247D15D|nr:FkbM family methyltransferase [Pedobacter sp. GR22-10]MCX2431361.1 FkbM family methyltransferase [Pedobacter sp. GR22-10]